MPNYSKVNLEEIESSSKTEGMQAHFGRSHLDSQELGVSLFSYQPNFQADKAHSHRVQEEVYVVVRGSGQILLDGQLEELKPMDTLRLAPEVVRAFRAGSEGLDIIAIGGQKPVEGDGQMETANWPA